MINEAASALIYFDGGGSEIRAEGIGADGKLLSHTYPGFSHGETNLEDYLSQCVIDFSNRFQTEISRAVCALATLPATEAGYSLLAKKIFKDSRIQELWICSDSVSASAATVMSDGVVIVAGTGITALAIGHNRTSSHTFSGDGYLIGDEGSAYWIGRTGLNVALRAADGRGGDIDLLDGACAHFATVPHELPHKVHQLARPVFSIAQFARVVSDFAAQGNEEALSILNQATSEIALIATTAMNKSGSKNFEVILMGGVLAPGNLLTQLVLTRLQSLGLNAHTSTKSPLQGAKVLSELTDPGVFKALIKEFRRP